MSGPGSDFSKIIASLDGDDQLFAEIALPVAAHYANYASQIQVLLEQRNYTGLGRIAHKLKATWSLYTSDSPELPEQLESAIGAGDPDRISSQAVLLANALHNVSSQLKSWVEWHSRVDK